MGKRQSNRLTPVAVNARKVAGYYADGNGLYLQVGASGSKSWVLRFNLGGRAREMGLGSVTDRTLAEARELARKYRQMRADGIDPIEHRNKQKQANLHLSKPKRSFEQCAHEYHALHASGWKNAKHADQWINTLTLHVFPAFGKKDVSEVSKSDILRALEPIWLTKAETASRVKQRIKIVLDWSAARDYCHGYDPHIWDQITRSLPKTKDIRKPVHFAACAYTAVHDAVTLINKSGASDTVKLAMEFIILTAARSGEVRGAKWAEIDFANKRWIIPAQRMKAGREHRIPLSRRAIEILNLRREAGKAQELVFASDRNKAYSDMTFTMLLR